MWKITLIWCIEYYLKVFPRSETMGILDMIKQKMGMGDKATTTQPSCLFLIFLPDPIIQILCQVPFIFTYNAR